MKLQFLVATILLGAVLQASAEETTTSQNETTMKLKASEGKSEVKDIDNEITNARLRAQLGSKSRWSFKSALGYSGGSIDKPLNNVRPNYRAGANREALPSLSGTVGINYRLTERDNLSFGTGISIMDPLHGEITKPVKDGRRGAGDEPVSRYQVATPSLDWSRGYKVLGTQMISGVSYSHYTDSDSADENAIGDISLSQTVLADLGNSRWSGGLSAAFSYSLFGGNVKNADLLPAYESGQFRRSEMLVGLYPFAEYSFTDKLSFRTVFGYFEFLKYKEEYKSNGQFLQREPYQSVGLGISITRDIYLYPNVQFTPKDIRADRTNVALSTNINI